MPSRSPRLTTAEGDRGVEQFNRSHKAEGGRSGEGNRFQLKPLDLPIPTVGVTGYVCSVGQLVVPSPCLTPSPPLPLSQRGSPECSDL